MIYFHLILDSLISLATTYDQLVLRLESETFPIPLHQFLIFFFYISISVHTKHPGCIITEASTDISPHAAEVTWPFIIVSSLQCRIYSVAYRRAKDFVRSKRFRYVHHAFKVTFAKSETPWLLCQSLPLLSELDCLILKRCLNVTKYHQSYTDPGVLKVKKTKKKILSFSA